MGGKSPTVVPWVSFLLLCYSCGVSGVSLNNNPISNGLFSDPVDACLKQLNNEIIDGITLEECKEKCSSATSFICHSLDYEGSISRCHLSEESKKTQPSAYTEPCYDGTDSTYLEQIFNDCVREENINYNGNNLRHARNYIKVDSVHECAKWCGITDRCKYWTFRKSNGVCRLKHSNAARRTDSDATSGTKGCGKGCKADETITSECMCGNTSCAVGSVCAAGSTCTPVSNWKQNNLDDCWTACGKTGGSCPDFCGSTGYCCRKGYDGCPPGAGEASPSKHTCVTQIGNCPAGWTSLTTGCYKLTDRGNQQQAATNCRSAGGFLAEIDSREEHNAVTSFTQENVWLGATDAAKDGEWVWSHSGNKITFTNWNAGTGEPNGGTRENCLEGNSHGGSTWNDKSCSSGNFRGLCELAEISEEREELVESGCQCMQEINDTTENMEKKIVELENQNNNFQNTTENMQMMIVELENQNNNFQDTTENMEKKIVELENQNNIFQDTTENMHKKIVELENQNNNFEETIGNMQKKNVELENQNNNFKNTTENMEKKIVELENQKNNFQDTIENMQKKNVELENQNNNFQNTTENMEKKIVELENLNKNFQDTAENRQKKIVELENQNNNFQDQLNTLGDRLAKLQILTHSREVCFEDMASPKCEGSQSGHVGIVEAIRVDGGWGQWQEWSQCSSTCGGGSQVRHRTCDNLEPQHGGKSCIGFGEDGKKCNEEEC